jgi:hypothetical protein
MVQWWAVVDSVMNLRVLEKTGQFVTSYATTSFSRRTLLNGIRWVVRCVIVARTGELSKCSFLHICGL